MKEVAVYEERDKVVTLYLEGHSEQQIARQLGLTRPKVVEHLREFKEVAKSDELLRERGREVVHEFDTQTARIITEFWDVIREADSNGDLKVRASALKSLSDVQARRVEVLQRAGLIAENSITDELAETQERVDVLVQVLKEIKNEHPEVAEKIAKALRKITGQVEPIKVVEHE